MFCDGVSPPLSGHLGRKHLASLRAPEGYRRDRRGGKSLGCHGDDDHTGDVEEG